MALAMLLSYAFGRSIDGVAKSLFSFFSKLSYSTIYNTNVLGKVYGLSFSEDITTNSSYLFKKYYTNNTI